MDHKFDVISIGDSTIDTFVKIHDATIECDINKQECRICLNYGGKIPVEDISHQVAGNAANVSVGFATLGLKCAIYTHLGDDWQGDMIKDQLYAKGVSGDYIVFEDNKNSNLSVVITYQGERTILVYHQPWNYKLPKLDSSTWVYFGSLSESFTNSNIVDELYHYVDRAGVSLAFAPGTYQLKADIKRYRHFLEKCDLLILNMEEAKLVLGIDKSDKVEQKDVLSKLITLGPRLVVVTDAEHGSFASDGQKFLKAPVFPTKLVEKTGAGDAYACAFVTALIHNKSMEDAMIWGTVNASHVIQEIGAQNGLMSRVDIEEHRKTVPELVATTL